MWVNFIPIKRSAMLYWSLWSDGKWNYSIRDWISQLSIFCHKIVIIVFCTSNLCPILIFNELLKSGNQKWWYLFRSFHLNFYFHHPCHSRQIRAQTFIVVIILKNVISYVQITSHSCFSLFTLFIFPIQGHILKYFLFHRYQCDFDYIVAP